MERGRLRNRVTIIPLNQIKPSSIPREIERRAEELVGRDNVWPAISLVCYEDEVDAAMKFVFGSSFVCRDSNSAKKVTFDKNIKKRSVTLEGDVFDPRGTLSGGSRQARKPVLLRLQELAQKEKQLESASSKLRELCKEKDGLKNSLKKLRDSLQQSELKRHELALLEVRLKQTPYQTAKDACEGFENECEELKEKQKLALEDIVRLQTKAEDIKASIKDLESSRKGKMNQIEKQVTKLKADIAELRQSVSESKQNVDRLEMEDHELVQEVETLRQQVVATEKSIEGMDDAISKSQKAVAKSKKSFESAQAAFDAEKALMSERDSEIKALRKEKERVESKNSELLLEVRKLEHKLSRAEKEREGAKSCVMRWLKEHDWIAEEKQLFGKRNTDYDFEAKDVSKALKDLAKKQKECEMISKKINKKALGMMEKAEQQYQELMKKKKIIEKDREKIEAVIVELDRKKNEALKKTWVKVNRDFGSVFAALLPGTKAKLEPPAGGSVLDGLEVCGCFFFHYM